MLLSQAAIAEYYTGWSKHNPPPARAVVLMQSQIADDTTSLVVLQKPEDEDQLPSSCRWHTVMLHVDLCQSMSGLQQGIDEAGKHCSGPHVLAVPVHWPDLPHLPCYHGRSIILK